MICYRAKKHGYTPYMIACENGHLEVVQLLVEAGCSTELTNVIGRTGLELAHANNHEHV